MSIERIDVHTHMMSQEYLEIAKTKGGPVYTLGDFETDWGVRPTLFKNGARFITVLDEMLDYKLRIENMDKNHVDLSIVSLSCPQCFWGDETVSVHTAQVMNDGMADAQRQYPDRLRYVATLPWQYADAARLELARALQNKAVGVAVTANIEGANLTDPQFAPIWEEIDRHGLPVIIHPGMPAGGKEMKLGEYSLGPAVGFMFDTTLAIARMIFDGFFERYRNLKIICLHGGGTLPYLVGRLDRIWQNNPNARVRIQQKPSTYLRQIYTDSMLFRGSALRLALEEFGEDNVMFGTDYPFILDGMESVPKLVDDLVLPVREKLYLKNALRVFRL